MDIQYRHTASFYKQKTNKNSQTTDLTHLLRNYLPNLDLRIHRTRKRIEIAHLKNNNKIKHTQKHKNTKMYQDDFYTTYSPSNTVEK